MTQKHLFSSTLIIIFTGLLNSCVISSINPISPTLIPTEYLSTVIAGTSQAMISNAISPTEETTALPPEPTNLPPEPTFSQTPEEGNIEPAPAVISTASQIFPLDIPFAEIQFLTPGALSKVISPINLHTYLIPGDSGRARIELLAEDGSLMYRKLFVFNSLPNTQANLRVSIDFEIKSVAETATLVISVDDTYNRLKTIASEEIILISLGDSEINPSGDHLTPILIQEPLSKTLAQGGTLTVSGLVRTTSDLPLLVELISTSGKIIGSRLAGIAEGSEGVHRSFYTEVAYEVSSPTWVRVTVSEWNKWQNGPAQLTSREILLSP